ncbi:DUF6086 family protein [Nocardia cyriacigeorgica]|uniref:DUF6086 family protein n=1 Tax=Nocardia cyriacigeorgica TaxID=135487 RepID=UPI003512C1D0
MSYAFEVGDETVWSPSLQVGELFVGMLQSTAASLGMKSGLSPIASDMWEIDIDDFERLVVKLYDLHLSTSHSVLRSMIEGIIGPCLVILERAGRPIIPVGDAGRQLIDQANALSMPM